MLASGRKWVALGVVVAATYVVTLAVSGLHATQGAAFTALVVAIVLGSALWLGDRIAPRSN